MYLEFDQMPASSRVWVYQSNRKLESAEQSQINQRLQSFCENWNTHGTFMPTSYKVLDSQIIVLAVDESNLGASGCSIDSSVRVLQELEHDLQINLRDQGKVSIKSNKRDIEVLPALGIKSALANSGVQCDSLVINPHIKNKKDLEALWIPIRDSWLNKYFPN